MSDSDWSPYRTSDPRWKISYITNGKVFAMSVKDVGLVWTLETKVDKPSETLTFMDGNPLITANDSGDSNQLPVAAAGVMLLNMARTNARLGYIHRGKTCNGAWMDGHVSDSRKFVYYDIKRVKSVEETDDSFTGY